MALDKLPAELMLMVIGKIDNPFDLYALISAAPTCLRLFRTRSQVFLRSILERGLHLEFRLDDLLSTQTKLDALCQLYGCIDRFLDDFACRAWHALDNPDPYSCDLPWWATKQAIHAPIPALSHWWPNAPLTEIEIARLQRAFIRYECWCRQFIWPPLTDDVHSSSLYGILNERYFQQGIDMLRSWEAEELTCVIQYIISLVGRLVDEMEDDYVREVIEAPGAQLPQQWPALSTPGPKSGFSRITISSENGTCCTPNSKDRAFIWNKSVQKLFPSSTYPTESKAEGPLKSPSSFYLPFSPYDCKHKLTSRLVSLGLPFVYRLLVSTPSQRRELIMSDRTPWSDSRDFLNLSTQDISSRQSHASFIYPSEPGSDSDTLNGSAYGWHTLGGLTSYQNIRASFKPEPSRFVLRATGWVFWSRERSEELKPCTKANNTEVCRSLYTFDENGQVIREADETAAQYNARATLVEQLHKAETARDSEKEWIVRREIMDKFRWAKSASRRKECESWGGESQKELEERLEGIRVPEKELKAIIKKYGGWRDGPILFGLGYKLARDYFGFVRSLC